MLASKKIQIIGFIIGIKKKFIFICLKKNKIGAIPREFFKEIFLFLGQVIIGKQETCSSILIKFRISRELQVCPYFRVGNLDSPITKSLVSLSKNIGLKLVGKYKFDSFFKKIGNFFEFESVIGINGFYLNSSNNKFFNRLLINKIIFNKCGSL
jgi:hypothetical protein